MQYFALKINALPDHWPVRRQTAPWPGDTSLAHWRAAELTAACAVRLKLFTLDRSLILRRLGALAAADRAAVTAALCVNLAVG